MLGENISYIFKPIYTQKEIPIITVDLLHPVILEQLLLLFDDFVILLIRVCMKLEIVMVISPNCKKSDHDNCTIDLINNYKCDCSCHVSKISPASMQKEKDKRGITREDE